MNDQREYADEMKSSRLMEVDKLKADQDKLEKARAEQEYLKPLGMDYASQYGPDSPIAKKVDSLLKISAERKSAEETERAKLEEARANAPGRNIPIIGDIQRGIDWFADKTKPAADVAYQLYTPGAGLSALSAGTRGAEALVSKIAPSLGKTALGRIGKTAAVEGIVGAPTAVGQTLTQNPNASNRELLESAAWGAGGGAVLGGLGNGAVEGAEAGFRSLLRPILEESMGMNPEFAIRQMGTQLQLPAPSIRGNTSRVVAPDIIYGDSTTGPSNEPLTLPPPKNARVDSSKLDELVRSKGYADITPETIANSYNDKTWYHGTGSSNLTADNLDPFAGSHESLFGQGVYLTDDPTIARGYANSRGKRGSPTLYESNVKVDRVLDLEKPITPDVADAILNVSKGLEYHDDGYISGVLREMISKGSTPEQVITKLRDEVGELSRELMIPTSEFVETFQDLALNLKRAGYDGLTHTGGHRTGNEAHRVLILLDPQNIHGDTVGQRQVTRFDKYNKPLDELERTRYGMVSEAAAPVQRVGRAPGGSPSASKYAVEREALSSPVASQEARTAAQQSDEVLQSAPERVKLNTKVGKPKTDELGFAQTVKSSENTSPELVAALNESPIVGARTSDILNRQQAAKLIEKHGNEGLFSILMSKKKQFSASETTAAQILAKHYSSLGGEANLAKAIDLVSKTAKGGREMGQAIQALSQWNKLDAEGALLLGERQLNRGIKDTAEWKKLTPTQGAPITEAAQRIGSAQETKNLADEVLNIVTNKQAGEVLTDAEKATIKQFQDQVKLINEKGKGILSKPKAKVDETIKEVSQIDPKARTRDQVVNFLDAKAEKARQRLAKSRNIGIVPNLNNPVFDYAVIGASKIANGIVKLSDFTEAMVRDFGDKIRPHINEVYTKATNMFRKENGLPTVEELDRVVNKAVKEERFSPEHAQRFKAWAAEISHMSDEFKLEATQDLQAAMKELGDSTLGQKLATIQTGAQLLNAVTVGRNILGNAALIISGKIDKVSAVPIDYALSKLTGERTIQWLPKTQEKMFRNFMMGTESGWKGVSPTGTLDSYGIHPNVFGKRNPLRYISKSLGASMQGFDFAAYRVAYGDVLATYGEQLGKAQGLSKEQIKQHMPKLIEQLDNRIHDLADEAGRYATFQDDTLLSQGAEFLKKGLNKLTDVPAQKLVEKWGLPKSLSTEGFGIGDIVLKYAKTPANLIMRAIDYSPMGFLRAAMELAPLVVNKSKFNQFKATRALSRAITGTIGLTGMGYILADAGILTGSASMDKDTRSIQEQSGQGAYKVNWSALGRFIASGFDYDAAKYREGDNLMDYQWLQPAAISVAMGVNANKAVKDRKEGADVTGWNIAQKALLGGLQTVLENPMVQGVSNVVDASSDLYKRQDPTKLRGLLKGAPATFVPTLLNQWRASTDNYQRETYSKNMLTEMGNLIKNKIPGLSKTLPISYDSLGNARERIQGGDANTVGQYLTAFFSPARMTEYQVSPDAKIVLDLMNQSDDQTILPRIADKYFHVKQGKDMKDLRVDLTAEQFSKLQQKTGELVTIKIRENADYLSNPNISLEKKVNKMKAILTDVGKKAREEIGQTMGYEKKVIKK
jgi:hypothetical protein